MKMDSSDLFNFDVKVKDEPKDVSLVENNYDVMDKIHVNQNIHFPGFLRENSARVLRENDVNSELNDEIKVEIECVDMKPGMNLLKVTKIEDISSNHLRDMNDSLDYQIKKKIKIEPADGVKEEVDVNYELSDACDTRETTFTRNSHLNCHDKSSPHGTVYACAIKSNLKKNTGKTRNGISHTCDICGKIYSYKHTLRVHMDSVHHKITHTCDICRKIYSYKHTLRVHMDSVHHKINHTCDVCGKSFTYKSNLQNHIAEVHIGVKHTCDVCGKKFTKKDYLKIHIDTVHKGMTPHVCDICGKSFTQKTNLQTHINGVHKGVKHTCDVCGKIFGNLSNLKRHVKAHNGTTYTRNTC